MIVSQHARQRFVERVAPDLSLTEAGAEIRSHRRAIEAAASIGCRYVRLASGARLVLQGDVVTTVLAPGQKPDFWRVG